MAGRGPAPKDPAQRRRKNAPAAGEWRELAPLEQPVLGAANRSWPEHVRALWVAWRADPITLLWGSSEVASASELARMWDSLEPSEQRLRMDGLGLSLKGKREARVRLVESSAEPVTARPARVRTLRAV